MYSLEKVNYLNDIDFYREPRVKRALLEIYGCCHICNSKVGECKEIEHIYPASKCKNEYAYLLNDYSNLILICGKCNKKKSGEIPNQDLYLDPTDPNNKDTIDKFRVNFDGELTYHNTSSNIEIDRINYMISLYDLNRMSLKISRSREYIKRWSEISKNGRLDYGRNDEYYFIIKQVEHEYNCIRKEKIV